MANVMENRISTRFTEMELKQMATARATYMGPLRAKTVALTPDELGGLNSLAVDNFVFVKDALQASDAEGRALLPPALAGLVPEAQIDVDFFEQLDAEELQLLDALIQVQHTKRLVAHEAYKVATQLYAIYGQLAEAGVPGAAARYDALKARFKDNGAGRPKSEPGIG
jgi:hypothetical protein